LAHVIDYVEDVTYYTIDVDRFSGSFSPNR